MEWVKNILKIIQNNRNLYIIAVPVVLGLCSTVIYYIQECFDKHINQKTSSDKHRMIKHVIITFILCVIVEFIPLFVSVFFPPIVREEPDGYLKLTFYDGSFAYRSYIGQEVVYKDDIITFDRAYFEFEIESTVYITIIDDDTNQIVYDGKS